MRIPINLASQPPENLRPLGTAVALTAAAALLFTAVFVRGELRSRREFRSLNAQMQRWEQDLEVLGGEQQELERWLGTPQARQIRERSAFLNSLILQKSLSWTQIFLDLEEILPAQARITAIRPSLNQAQQAELNLTVEAASMAPLVEFLKHLESSAQFGSPQVGAQRFATEQTEDGGISIDVTARYLQQTPRGDQAPAAAQSQPAAAPATAEEPATRASADAEQPPAEEPK